MIANQILRKYSNDSRAEKVRSAKLAIPHQGIKVDRDTRTIYAPCLKLSLNYGFPDNFEKVNQIEIGKEYAYVAVSIPEPEPARPESWIGVDRNTTGHIAVVADPETGKVLKLGKSALHVHQKYKNMRRTFQKKVSMSKSNKPKIGGRIVRTSAIRYQGRSLTLLRNRQGIKLEDLAGIRNSKKQAKSFRYVNTVGLSISFNR
jgi:putative transposase